MNNVKYYEVLKTNEVRRYKVAACFSQIFTEERGYGNFTNNNTATIKLLVDKQPTKHVYLARAFKTLTLEEVTWWCTEFLPQLLDSNIFKCHIRQTNKNNILVRFVLNSFELKRYAALLYLTSFRYLDEGYGFVKTLYKYRDENIEALYSRLCTLHQEFATGKCKEKEMEEQYAFSGHDLMQTYGSSGAFNTFAEFQNNLKQQKCKSVYRFFEKSNF